MNNNIDFSTATSGQIGGFLCARLAEIRLARNISQTDLAANAGISLRTLQNLEKGEKVNFDTFIRVMSALRIHQSLETLLPDPTIRPIERVASGDRERKRASAKRSGSSKSKAWAWSDGVDDDE